MLKIIHLFANNSKYSVLVVIKYIMFQNTVYCLSLDNRHVNQRYNFRYLIAAQESISCMNRNFLFVTKYFILCRERSDLYEQSKYDKVPNLPNKQYLPLVPGKAETYRGGAVVQIYLTYRISTGSTLVFQNIFYV